MDIVLESTIKCPFCGFEEKIKMPEDKCMKIIICNNCKRAITPKEGNCCVFCSYAEYPCPAIQQEKDDSKLFI